MGLSLEEKPELWVKITGVDPSEESGFEIITKLFCQKNAKNASGI